MPMVPNNFSGLITFTRASGATFVGSNGLIQLAATNVPRFDYDPVTLAVKGLLIEEQRTNLLTYSEQFDNAAWAKTNATITANTIVAPDGTLTGDKFIPDATTAQHAVNAGGAFASVAYTTSVYAKAGEYRYATVNRTSGGANFYAVTVDLQTGLVTQESVAGNISYNTTVTNVGNGWWRIATYGSATSGNFVFITGHNNATYTPASFGMPSFTGDGTSGIFIWGAQIEAGSFPTSYIPTVASQVTRSADVASVNTLSPWYNAAEGTIYTEASSIYGVAALAYTVSALDDGTNSNRISTRRGENTIAYGVDTGGVSQVGLSSSFVSSNLATFKVAATYKADDFAASFNGAAALTDTLGTVPTGLVALRLGYPASTSGGQRTMSGHIRRITYYPRRLSNAELQALTV